MLTGVRSWRFAEAQSWQRYSFAAKMTNGRMFQAFSARVMTPFPVWCMLRWLWVDQRLKTVVILRREGEESGLRIWELRRGLSIFGRTRSGELGPPRVRKDISSQEPMVPHSTYVSQLPWPSPGGEVLVLVVNIVAVVAASVTTMFKAMQL